MKSQLLVTAIGEDRPGIVAHLTETFVKHGANLEDSRMAILGGEFAAIILVSVPSDQCDCLKKELSNLKDIVVSTRTTNMPMPGRFTGYVPYDLLVNGADHEGIVHKVSAFLRDRSIN